MRIANVPVIVSLTVLAVGCANHEPYSGYTYSSTPAHAGEVMTARDRADLALEAGEAFDVEHGPLQAVGGVVNLPRSGRVAVALEVLGELRDPKTDAALQKALTDEDANVRANAAWARARIAGDK